MKVFCMSTKQNVSTKSRFLFAWFSKAESQRELLDRNNHVVPLNQRLVKLEFFFAVLSYAASTSRFDRPRSVSLSPSSRDTRS